MASVNPGTIFIRNDVTKILQRVTGFDVKKIFQSGFNLHLKDSEIKLLTTAQLERVGFFLMWYLMSPKKVTTEKNYFFLFEN